MNGENLYVIAKELYSKGYRINIRISDLLREDYNIYEDNYPFNKYESLFGEEISHEIESIRIISGRKGQIHLNKSGIGFLDIFKEESLDNLICELQKLIEIVAE